jgi:hypothetical protein
MKKINKISIVKDVFTNTPHVMAISSDEEIKIKAITEYGKLIIKEYNYQNGYINAGVPDGFVKTDFKQLTPNMEKMFSAAFDEIGWNTQKVNEMTTKIINYQKTKSFISRNANIRKSNSFKSPSSRSLFKFKNKINKINILNYKAKTFKDNNTTSALVEKIKSRELAFDRKTNTIAAKKNDLFSQNTLDLINQDSKNIRLLRRHFGEKNEDFINMAKKYKRRTLRRATKISEKKLFDDIEEKNIFGFQKFNTSIRTKLKRKTGKKK